MTDVILVPIIAVAAVVMWAACRHDWHCHAPRCTHVSPTKAALRDHWKRAHQWG